MKSTKTTNTIPWDDIIWDFKYYRKSYGVRFVKYRVKILSKEIK